MEENEKTGSTPEIEDQPQESTETTPNPETEEQPSLEEIAKAYNMTPAQVIKSYGEAQKKITKTSQELSDYRKNMQWAEQFKYEISNRKGFREHIESFFEDSRSDVPSEVKGAIDPVYQRINELEVKLLSSEMNARIDALAQQYPVDATVRQQIFEEISRTANPDIEAIYFKIKGPEFFSRASGEEMRMSGKEKNSKAYVQNRGGAPKTKAEDVKGLSKTEWSEALDNEISGLFRTTN